MRRSSSNPSLQNPSKIRKTSIPRNVSVPAAMGFVGDFVNDVVMEYQAECALHVVGYAAGTCSFHHDHRTTFPLDLINGREDTEVVETIGACLASPPPGECTQSFDEENTIKHVVQELRRKKIGLKTDQKNKDIS